MTESFRPTVLRAQARQALQGKWGQGVIVALIFLVFYALFYFATSKSYFIGPICTIFIFYPIAFGVSFVFLDLFRGGNVVVETIFEPFRKYGRYAVTGLLVYIYTLLWTLLLIIPGVIKALSYSMTPYIVRENPDISVENAIKRSMEMMDGHKMDLLLLQLSFIGWSLLAILTCGIGLLWLIPYTSTAMAAFYEKVKEDHEKVGEFYATKG